jgi:hypothetical protein
VLLVAAGGFGIASVALHSWQAVAVACLGAIAAFVEMHMRWTGLQEQLDEFKAALAHGTVALDKELTNIKNDIIRLNNKNGLR